MQTHIKFLEESDLQEIVEIWNKIFIYDKLTEDKFRDIIFEDPNYEKDGNLIALVDNKIVAYVGVVAREGIKGRDGKGMPFQKDLGHIKCSFSLKYYQEIEKELLGRVLKYLKEKGKSKAVYCKYTGKYFFPGIDERYVSHIEFYKNMGFQVTDFQEDVVINLKKYQPTEYQKQKLDNIKSLDIKIISYKPEYLDKLRILVDELKFPHWFPEGWDINFGKKGNPIIALMKDQVVGWAEFYPEFFVADYSMGAFGPIAVNEKYRGEGIGTCLLVEAILRMKALKLSKAYAGWANTPFYIKNDWKIARKYAVLEKGL